jgi:hypothetical protein
MRDRRILNKSTLAGTGLTRGLLCFAVLSVSTMVAADVSGIWSGQTTDRNGDLQDLSFRFAWKGNTLTGKMYGDNESTPIEDAGISGNQITFMVTIELNGAVTKFLYTGTVTGDEMDLLRKRVNLKVDAAAKDAAAANKAAQPQHLRFKRIA